MRPWFDSWIRKIPWRRDRLPTLVFMGFPGGSDSKASACSAGDLGSIPGLGRSPWGRLGSPLQCSCLENPHGQRSLVGYSLWGHKELDTTKWLSTHTHTHTHTHIHANMFHRLWNFKMYSFFMALGLHCCVQASLVAASRGHSLAVAHRLLTAMASLDAKNGL